MKLLEYEAKNILSQYKIAVPDSVVVHKNTKPDLDLPVVLKSQVPIGGRGKAGGIRIVEPDDAIEKTIDDLFKLDIKGHRPQTLLAEELLDIKHEYYLSILIDRNTSTVQLMAGREGGVEVEENASDSYLKIGVGGWEIGNGTWDEVGQALADYYELPGQTFALQDLVENLYKCFVKNDATLIEINPLVLTADNKLVAGDCKMELDDNAAWRHDWNFEQKPAETNFVTIDKNGQIATIANGAGLAMATVDAVANAGMSPANFLDVGGGANTESVLAAFNKIMEFKNIKAIVINIFAGITRLDEIANAIVEAKSQIPNLPDLCIRLAGTNYDDAKQILDAHQIALLPTLEACLGQAKAVAS